MNHQSNNKTLLHTYLVRLMHAVTCEESITKPGDKVCLTQMSAKKGIKIFGERALNAIITEYEQLENLSVFTPLNPNYMNKEDRKNALYAIDLIKEKRTGKLKGRTVADGRKQQPL